MSSEGAAFQGAQQRHHRYMVFGKKQRYIEVFQCSGEDMNHVLTGNNATASMAAALASVSSPVKNTSATSTQAGPTGHHTHIPPGLLPPGMFTIPPSAAASQSALTGFDPNSASTFAALAQMQAASNPFLLMQSQNFHGLTAADPNQLLRPPALVRPPPTSSSAAPDMSALFGLQQAQQGLMMGHPGGFLPFRHPMGLMGMGGLPYAAHAQQLQLQQQHQLLQSQLAAQRLLMPGAGLIGPRPVGAGMIGKRSFEQAFTSTTATYPAGAIMTSAAEAGGKRMNYGDLGAPTISAGPTTYNH
jgi:hypothetical protein